jgi:hypothetical protein
MHGLHNVRPILLPTLFAGIFAAAVTSWQNAGLESQVRAEPRRITPQEPDQHFKSGGRLSEAVLQEILTVLKRIDERLERMEKSSDLNAAGIPGPAVRAGGVDAQLPAETPPIQVRRNR